MNDCYWLIGGAIFYLPEYLWIDKYLRPKIRNRIENRTARFFFWCVFYIIYCSIAVIFLSWLLEEL